MDNELCLGGNGNIEIDLNARMANRHGLIAGATGTGKTITCRYSQMDAPFDRQWEILYDW